MLISSLYCLPLQKVWILLRTEKIRVTTEIKAELLSWGPQLWSVEPVDGKQLWKDTIRSSSGGTLVVG